MIDVWHVDLDKVTGHEPTVEERERASHFAREELSHRYLAAHAALRAILAHYTSERLEFALKDRGKPFLQYAPEVRFNLSHSRGRALIAVSSEVEVGVDIEFIRPVPNFAAIVERYFPPGEPVPADEVDFFRRWTRMEAQWKARGVGLYGSGTAIDGEWTVLDVDAGQGYTAAVAAEGLDLAVKIHYFGADE
jgi:4'-phosphopantetheinyl transferase